MKQHRDIRVMVFDFDGTMVQSLDPVVDQVNRLLKPVGLGTIDDQDLSSLS